MDIAAIRIQEDRLRQDLLDLGRFGEIAGRGIERTALSDADLAARHWFKERMREAGLKVHEDAAANIIGRMDPSSGPNGEPCIATGSHIDTVAQGGKFDGLWEFAPGSRPCGRFGKAGFPFLVLANCWFLPMRREAILPGHLVAGRCLALCRKEKWKNPEGSGWPVWPRI